VLVAALVAFAPTVPAVRAEPATRPNALTIEPLAVVFARTIALEYERGIGGWVSVFVQPSFVYGSSRVVSGDDNATTTTDGEYFAVGGTLGVRIFPWRAAPTGPFVSPFGGLAYTHARAGGDSASGLGWSVGGLIGYTFVLGSVFELSLGGGAAYAAYAIEAGGKRFGERGVLPAFLLAVGAVF
jgi:hypothetical protein